MASLAPRISVLLAVVLLFLFAPLGAPLQETPRARAQTPRTVFVHLFEWKWDDIAQECESYLGPQGFSAVQVSPPHEHMIAAGYPWWQRYQGVSYRIESRSGSRQAFADMARRCGDAGVDIYVDAIINHMSGFDSGSGSAGSSFTHYDYPGLYSYWDFHHCGRNGNDDIINYGDRYEVQNCELHNLADLDTGSSYVRDQIVGYLNDLVSLGVDGFRIDAAKHIHSDDIAAILSRVNGSPYIFQEVLEAASEPIKASEYFQNGDVTELKYSNELSRMFLDGELEWLHNFGEEWQFMSSDMAVVFTDNHDNQRGHGTGGNIITHKHGKLYNLANIFMLAWPYGYPKLMSSYKFNDNDEGPPSDAYGNTNSIYSNGSPDCFDEWQCEHRWQGIGNMVAFRNHTASNFFVSDWWDNGNDQIAFGRGDKGFVAINREGYALDRVFQTSMPAGSYCDVISGAKTSDGSGCTGRTVTVNSAGQLSMRVETWEAVAIHAGSKLDGSSSAIQTTFNVYAETAWGQNVYAVGNVSALGGWDPAQALALSSAGYPTWSGSAELPPSTFIEYKYIKKDGSGNVIWESGSNRTFTTPASGAVTRDDSWR